MTKTFIYGIIALLIVIIGGFFAFFFTWPGNGNTNDSGTTGGFFSSLFPFSSNQNASEQPLFTGDNSASTTETAAPRLREVSINPVSGGFLFERDGSDFIRFIDRATGHLYETEAAKTSVSRITNTTVPGIQEALWVDENHFIVRYLDGDTIQTFYASLDPETEGEQSLNGHFISSFLRGTLDPVKENLFAVFTGENGSNLVVSDVDGGNSRTVYSSPLTSWIPLQSDKGLFVYTAPSSGFEGFLYQVVGGTLTKIYGNVPGFTAKISSNGRYALAGSGNTNEAGISLIDINSGNIYPGLVDTLPAKCLFVPNEPTTAYCGVPNTLPDGVYPNDWLSGRVSTSDSIWKIDFIEGTASFVINPEDEVGQSIDVFNPSISPDGKYLLFMNKDDLSLWSLRLED